ncbi:MAG TPA: TonB-dependent receptor [Steroidobacteraceae bacterium]|nr:TonB-dependent receptor [Steroidobacteraceae bacterium]
MNRQIAARSAACTLLSGVLMAFLAVLVPAASRAAAAGSSDASTSGEYGNGLEEIIVTATRREASLQNVPISIEAFGKDDLARGNIKTIDDISALTPGLQFAVPNGFSSAFTTIAIRGLNTNTGPPTVGVYLDDTVILSRLSGYANQGNVYPMVWDLDRVEVLRGPQGTLFGAGAEAGTVRFISNQPSLTTFSGSARGDLSETEGGRLSYVTAAAVGGPIIQDELGYRVSIWDEQDGGWVSRVNPIDGSLVARDANTMDKFAAKAALAFKIGEVLITPQIYYQNVHQDDARRFYAAFSDADAGIFNNGVLVPEVWTDKWTLSSIKAEGHLPFADFTGNASYMYRNANEILDESAFVCPGLHTPPGSGDPGCGNPLGTGYPSLSSQVAYTPTGLSLRAYTAEGRLASNQPDSRLSWVAGIYWERRVQRDFQDNYSPYAYPQYFNVAPPCPQLLCALVQDEHELFVDAQTTGYAQTDLKITDALTLTTGVRVAHITINGADTTSLSALNGALPYAPFNGSNNVVTWRGGLSYQLDHDNQVYFSFSEGYRPGGGNALIPNTTGPCAGVPQVQTTYAPDTVHAFEVGAKDTVFDGHLQVNTSVFYNKWHNIQQYAGESCGPFAYGTNGGDAVSDGFDMQLRAILTQQLHADVSVGYVNAYYSKSGYLPGQPQSDSTILVREGDKVGVLPQVNAPWNVSAALNYEMPLSNGDKFHAWAETLYTSRNPGPFITQNTNINGYPLAVPDPPTHMYNARVGYLINKVDLTAFVNNIANSTPALSKYQANGTSNLITYTTFQPRTIGVSVNYSF